MSGAEVVAVLGLISSIISIVDGTKKVYDAATNVQGLPQAFREVADRLPIVGNTLDSTKQNIEESGANNDSCKGVKHIVEACEEKARNLKDLFHKAIPAEGTSDLKRYYKAVKVWGRGSEVENLMKGILEDVQLLACERGMKTATKTQQEQIIKAITEVSAVSPSVPEYELQEAGFTNTNHGSGTQYNAQGENIAQGSARQYVSGGGTMNFGQTSFDVTTQSFSVLRPNEDIARACLSALFLTDPRDDRAKLMSTKGPRVDGTCRWIKSHALYDSWLRSHSQLLWVSGDPGKGKTMLSIFLAEELEQTARLSQNKLFLQYFCDYKDEKRNTAVAVIRGLVFQLLQSHPKMFDHILPSFMIQKESLFLSTSFETLWRIFESMVSDPALETTYCVLDGLDECDEASLEVLLRKFTDLFSTKTDVSSSHRLKLLIISRDLPDFIPESLSSFPRISLNPDADTEISKDIELFIKTKVKELSKRKHYPKTLRIYLEDIFRNRAQGTFLWIGIVVQALGKYKVTEVEKALDDLPSGLDELYTRILLQIESGRREVAARILRWVVMAVRPLTLSELSIVIKTTIEPCTVAFTPDEVIRDKVSHCGHILVVKGDEVSLIHQSATDYLLRKDRDSNSELEFFRVKEEVANLEIASTCLDYLQSGALENSEPNLLSNISHLRAFPLLSYAALHWHEHASSLARSEHVFDLLRPFYHEKSPIRTSWLKAYWDSEMCGLPPRSFTLLMLASYFGILPLAERLILTETWTTNKEIISSSLNKIDGQGMTALIWAASGGHEAIVRLLLENGADIEGKGRWGQAVIAAAENGHGAIVRLLWNKGMNIKAKNRYKAIALIDAADSGHEAVVRLLLENGVDIETRNENEDTVLIVAARSGHEALMRILLEKGADIRAKNKYQATALVEAADSEHEAIVRLLLENGADVETKIGDGATVLIAAARSGHETVVRLLLEKGADIEARHCGQETALIRAAEFGFEAVIRLLLEKGADINAQDGYGETALMKAVECGYNSEERVVRLLLNKGADVNAKNAYGETALMKAAGSIYSYKERVTLIRLLLEKGADIEFEDIDGDRALIRVVMRWHED